MPLFGMKTIADKILAWLQTRNATMLWENHEYIEPSYEGAPKPKVIEFSNCCL